MHILFTEDIDWQGLGTAFTTYSIRNERSTKQLSQAFKQSQGCCFSHIDDMLIGTARPVSNHTHCTYITDVWTHPAFRRRGIAIRVLRELLRRLHHYHFYVFTDPLWLDLYAKIGFTLADKQPISMGKTRFVGRAPRFIKPPG